VADLFAGSGALGIEALSRGARAAVFVELDPRCVRLLHQNLARLGLTRERARVRRADARRWLHRLGEGTLPEPERARVLLLDPPYLPGEVGRLLPQLAALVESGAVAVCVLEHADEDVAQAPAVPAGLRAIVRHHGRGAFTLLEKESP
jgi:16S rRNA (guanine966-N2)-methyltransferase